MTTLREHADLRARNTFGLPGCVRWLAEVSSAEELRGVLADPRVAGLARIMLGGGSNVVLSGAEVNALMIRIVGGGWRVTGQDGSRVRIEADAGMNWHALVTACVAAGYGGIENLALIPGTVGAAPIQNIGAYGVELVSVLHAVETVDLTSGAVRVLPKSDCRLSYRDSVFRHEASGLAITRVWLDLDVHAPLSLAYRDLSEELALRGNPAPTRQLVYEMVCDIRRRKLPDPEHIGNAGSFFRNPVVGGDVFQRMQVSHPGIVGYPQPDGRVKLAAGWLIERAGWKGFREGAVGVHARQALVLVNHGGATGEQILALARRIVDDVQARYGVVLEMEPRVL